MKDCDGIRARSGTIRKPFPCCVPGDAKHSLLQIDLASSVLTKVISSYFACTLFNMRLVFCGRLSNIHNQSISQLLRTDQVGRYRATRYLSKLIQQMLQLYFKVCSNFIFLMELHKWLILNPALFTSFECG